MAPDWVTGDPAALRAWRDRQPEVLRPVMPAGVENVAVAPQGGFLGGILCRPSSTRRPGLVLHFHGGGFVVGSPHTHRIVAATLCAELGMPVLSAAYRLAPEHAVPVQAQDAAQAIAWAAESFGGPILLCGDSAGALVCLWGYHASSLERRRAVVGALLFYGVFGGPSDPDADRALAVAQGLDSRAITAMYRRVDPHGLIGRDPNLSPELPGFCLPRRVAVVAAEQDPLARHSLRFAAARWPGVSLLVAPGLAHGYLSKAKPSEPAKASVKAAAAISGLPS